MTKAASIAPDLRDRLHSAVLSDILDAMGYRDQVLDPAIRPLDDKLVLMGKARTGLYWKCSMSSRAESLRARDGADRRSPPGGRRRALLCRLPPHHALGRAPVHGGDGAGCRGLPDRRHDQGYPPDPRDEISDLPCRHEADGCPGQGQGRGHRCAGRLRRRADHHRGSDLRRCRRRRGRSRRGGRGGGDPRAAPRSISKPRPAKSSAPAPCSRDVFKRHNVL